MVWSANHALQPCYLLAMNRLVFALFSGLNLFALLSLISFLSKVCLPWRAVQHPAPGGADVARSRRAPAAAARAARAGARPRACAGACGARLCAACRGPAAGACMFVSPLPF